MSSNFCNLNNWLNLYAYVLNILFEHSFSPIYFNSDRTIPNKKKYFPVCILN